MYLLAGINLLKALISQETESSNPKNSVEDINHITWTIGDATHI